MPAANSSRCPRASSIPTSWSCSNCGRTRPRLTPTPNCRRSARLCRRGWGSALASARTIPTTVPAERGRRQNAGLVFRNRPLLRALEPAAGMADAARRVDEDADILGLAAALSLILVLALFQALQSQALLLRRVFLAADRIDRLPPPPPRPPPRAG